MFHGLNALHVLFDDVYLKYLVPILTAEGISPFHVVLVI